MTPNGSGTSSPGSPSSTSSIGRDDAPPDLVTGLLRAIVGFELTIVSVAAKEKLSQNRSAADRGGVIAGLRGESDAGAAAIADLMRPGLPEQETKTRLSGSRKVE